MNRTKKFFYNTVSTAVLQLITMAVGFILPKVMLSVYGSEINGLVTSITQFISYLTLVEAGLSGATVYSLYKPLADNDTHAINRVVVAAKNFYYKTGYLFLGLVLGGALVYPMFVKTGLLSKIEVGVLFVVLGTNGILEFFTLAKYRALLTADQKTYVISIASILQVVLNCVIIAVLSYTGLSIVVVRAVAIAAILLRTVILWIYCRRKYKYLDFSVEPDNSAMNKRWGALYFHIIGVVHTGAPVIIATALLSLNDVSIYSIYYIVVAGINSVLGIFTSGISAGFGDMIVRGDDDGFKKAFQQFEYMYYIMVTVVYSVMMATYIPFIKIYTDGADINYIYPVLAVLLTLNGYFYSLKTPYGMLTISAGKYDESKIPISVQAIIEVGVGIVFAAVLGLNGIVLGALCSNIYRDIEFIFFAPKHLIKYNFKETLTMWARSIVLFVMLCVILNFVPNGFVSGYFSWLLLALLSLAISGTIVIAVNYFMDKKRFKGCFARIKGLIKRG